MDQAYWRRGEGEYEAVLRIAVSGTTNIELWNSTTNQLLARRVQTESNGPVTVTLDATLRGSGNESVFDGWGIWRINAAPPKDDNLEVRVFAPRGNDVVDIYKVSLQPVTS
jgi:hypothetical protein